MGGARAPPRPSTSTPPGARSSTGTSPRSCRARSCSTRTPRSASSSGGVHGPVGPRLRRLLPPARVGGASAPRTDFPSLASSQHERGWGWGPARRHHPQRTGLGVAHAASASAAVAPQPTKGHGYGGGRPPLLRAAPPNTAMVMAWLRQPHHVQVHNKTPPKVAETTPAVALASVLLSQGGGGYLLSAMGVRWCASSFMCWMPGSAALKTCKYTP